MMHNFTKQMNFCVNKMDLVEYSKEVFDQISEEYKNFADALQFEQTLAIPISALKGDNIIKRSSYMSWFQGPTLLGFLEIVDTNNSSIKYPLRFPVQWVTRSNTDFRGFSGTVEAGTVNVLVKEVNTLAISLRDFILSVMLMPSSLNNSN